MVHYPSSIALCSPKRRRLFHFTNPDHERNGGCSSRLPSFEEAHVRGTRNRSCSSSTFEAEDIDLDCVAPGTYSVWDPRSSLSSSNSLGRPCKKSSSTGSSSKSWKLQDLLPGSHIDGKEPLVFLTPSKRNNKVAHEVSKPSSGDYNASISMEKEAQYTNRAIATAKEGDQSEKKSMLPYGQEFIGLFANVGSW